MLEKRRSRRNYYDEQKLEVSYILYLYSVPPKHNNKISAKELSLLCALSGWNIGFWKNQESNIASIVIFECYAEEDSVLLCEVWSTKSFPG